MKYLLDTNIIAYLKDQHSEHYDVVGRNFLAKLEDDAVVCVSLLTLYEVEVGIALANTDEVRDFMQETMELIENHLEVLPLTREGARLFGKLKADYIKTGGRQTKTVKRDDIDLMLASTAITENATLVSNDSIFRDLIELNSDLKYENWVE